MKIRGTGVPSKIKTKLPVMTLSVQYLSKSVKQTLQYGQVLVSWFPAFGK